jgi:type VI secretion system Hcp family effector
MKKLNLMLVAIIISFCSISQSPQAFKYQAVARDNGGNVLANQNVSFQISILEGSTSGIAVYVETHDTITNEFGLVNLEIGNGAEVSGVFADIDWGGDIYFLQIEMDEAGGPNYLLMGTTQLMSVPYALYSESTGDTSRWIKSNDDLYYNKGNVGIGTTTPAGILDIGGEYHFPAIDGTTGQVLQTDGSGILNWSSSGGGGSSDSIVIGGPTTAADERWYIGMEMNGIQGSWNEMPDCEECSKVFDVDWYLHQPFETSSGGFTGVREHNALTVYKNIDMASVLLIQKLTNNETITEMTLKFYWEDPGNPGNFQRYYTITLLNAFVIDFCHNVYHRGNDGFAHMDKVSFIYQTIIWTWEDGGISHQDNWTVFPTK